MSPASRCRVPERADLSALQHWYDHDGPDVSWLSRFMNEKTARVWVMGSPPLAVAWYRVIGPEAELIDVRVAPGARGRGHGGSLLAETLAALDDSGVAAVHLEVRASNDVARHLYTRLGFAVTGERRDYYPSLSVPDRRENAILMSRKSPLGCEKS